MIKSETVGTLENLDGLLWLVVLNQGHGIPVGLEDFEGKLVKVTRTETKIIIEVIRETEPVPWEQFHKEKELCMVGG